MWHLLSQLLILINNGFSIQYVIYRNVACLLFELLVLNCLIVCSVFV